MNSPMPSSRPVQRIASVLAVSALALGLAACSKTEEPTVGQRMDSAVEKTEQAAADARVKADNAMQSAENSAKDAANSAMTARSRSTALRHPPWPATAPRAWPRRWTV